MKHFLCSIAFLLISFMSTYAQKEVYFNNTASEDIKVQSLQGIEVSSSIDPVYSIQNASHSAINPNIYVGYFNEKRMASSWTLNTTVGLNCIFYEKPIYVLQTDSSFNGNGGYGSNSSRVSYMTFNGQHYRADEYSTGFALGLEVGVEPRYYLGFKDRYVLGKTSLNSGWFLSFPLSFNTNLLQSPEPLFNQGWLPGIFSVNAAFRPTLGYRRAITKKLFIEGSMGAGARMGYGNNTYNYKYYFFGPSLDTQIKLKVAYTF